MITQFAGTGEQCRLQILEWLKDPERHFRPGSMETCPNFALLRNVIPTEAQRNERRRGTCWLVLSDAQTSKRISKWTFY
jgi:hypothetical protein